MWVRGKLVGVTHYTRVPLTPDDPVRVVRERDNPEDPNALQVEALLSGAWTHVGYVDRDTAAWLGARAVGVAQLVTQGCAYELPMRLEVA